ncbi:X-Pro dipeptidyl-peptidase-domain-containing protein [Cercophora newfieldiana]|uniref:X-Pro dipeptidyl-peptidase-domain-containing protein n=1 Tax=Cercophora newfieldiana TaxID=92897 RepID=A0AA40CHG8_9PEZI|nr:X-Pro dipeptidyl-peptidase-domain-containing protein [Cercophora newfieldiana]
MAPVRRGLFGALLDRLVGWKSSLVPETTDYTTERFRIPVGENVYLAADLYQPLQPKPPKGTILIRTPYGIGIPMAIAHARPLAARGYQVLLSSCRGTDESDGELDPGRHEAADGQAVVAWMREQPWYTGSFAAVGASYIGYVQWALLSENPPADFRAAAIYTGPHDMGKFIWGTGALDYGAFSWADFTTRQKRGDGQLSLMLALRSQQATLGPIFESLPLMGAVDKYFQDAYATAMPPWLGKTLAIADLGDKYWTPINHGDALQKANLPILLTAGWYDLVLPQVMEQYEILSQRGCDVALTIGPWTHLQAGTGFNILSDTYDWFEEHFTSLPRKRLRKAPVRVFVTGMNKWLDLPKWPPEPASHEELFFSPDKSLVADKPGESNIPDSTFTFDPEKPTPFVGTPPLFDRGVGQRKPDTALATRHDVLSFTTTSPLEHDLEVCGKPVVSLHHSSDHPHVDLLVILSEVDPAGVSRPVSQRYMRLGNNQESGVAVAVPPTAEKRIELLDCAHLFRRGNRLRVMIAGGSHPRYLRNLGTGEHHATSERMEKAVHSVGHRAGAESRLILPLTKVESEAVE